MSRIGKINWKRLWWAIKKELGILLFVAVMLFFIAIPWALIYLTGFYWWILLYPAALFIDGVYGNYKGR